ncbi:chitinase [Deinococcus metalli]|uniref:chitinase n=1 Tax=Deinococcus metalli TaxID=1141878 RepID=A0A7W8NP08_9DEIO|nr:glycosyl hydrolase family 18 protein [Deinococcus metalli]MBB5376311.1 chitinase [Deinococcus metalli]GHF39256.1 chitinase [Deinococcus metalli]
MEKTAARLTALLALTLALGACGHPDPVASGPGLSAQAACSAWTEGPTYTAGQVVTYQGLTYTAIQTHTAYAGANWNPRDTPSLWQPGGTCGGAADTTAPSVSVSSSASSVTTPSTLTLSATASDNVGVTKVEFYDGATLLGTDTAAPYTQSVALTSANNGTHSYTARAYDAAGNSKVSAAVSVTVTISGSGDTTAPTVGLSASPSTVSAAGSVTLSATASDTVGVSKVEFYQGSTLLATDTTAPYSATEAVTSAQNGTRTYTAKAYDAAGNTASAAASVTVSIGTAPPPASGYKRVAYFTQWGIYGRNYLVKNIDTSGTAATLTHINYAFGNIYNAGGTYKCDIVTRAESGNGDGGDAFADYGKSFDAASSVDGVADVWNQPLKGNFNQLRKLKAKYPNLRLLISLGGWTWSRYFSAAASTDASRRALVASCLDVYIKGNLPVSSDGAGGAGAAAGVFDGIDIDWEYPGGGGLAYNTVSAADRQNFTLLLQEFRRQLDALKPGSLLTIAAPGGADKIANQDPAAYRDAVSWVNIMTYDFRGAWDSTGPTNFHSNLYTDPNGPGTAPARTYSVDAAVTAFLNAGMPASKIVIGVPFYGRGWTGVPGAGNGLYQSATGAARGTYEAGIEDYKVLKNAPGTVYRSGVTGQMWKYDGTTFWSYDDETVIAAKMAYIKSRGLGGAMAWSLDGDDATGTLARAISNGLK